MNSSEQRHWPTFAEMVARHGHLLTRDTAATLQVNVGRLCNLSCRHCHLEAGPARTEIMTRETMTEVKALASRVSFASIDVTGGAPEMNPHICELLDGLAKHTPRLLLRSNLVAMADSSRAGLLDLCRQHRVVIVASFPALNEAQAESQRGNGAFQQSIAVLRILNDMGYGHEGSGLELDLVSNPAGAFMPADQAAMEQRFHQVLFEKWGITFNRLFSLANVPLGRFKQWLEQTDNYNAYMGRLVAAFNPCAVAGVMCRSLISVGWDGFLSDCDFNQALNLPLGGVRRHVSELGVMPRQGDLIAVSDHCYACTAGAGFT
ncbi:MAG: arsenosugar biosynthesis radical SAM protein ArsS [Proteobacteria bacterium]|nr:radical SAM/Cys-rich domain protein [Desulfobulbaceae bacterium]MBU4153080.1 arsenosugar biosynthesis radical SAM protein ArsS [Pseudomonadota bacterium]